MTWLTLIAMMTVQAEDRLVWPMPEGFKVGHQQTSANGSEIEERVPSGETVEDWTRMATRLVFPGTVAGSAFNTAMAQRWQTACPGAVATPSETGPRGADIRIDCPRNPGTGKPETMFQRVLPVPGKAYILQVAFRSMPTPEQARWAKAELDRATLCSASSTESPCR